MIVESDMNNVIELFEVFNEGTHGSAGAFDLPQLQAIRKRVEDGITFAGGSCVVGPDGTILAAASPEDEQRLDVTLEALLGDMRRLIHSVRSLRKQLDTIQQVLAGLINKKH